MDPYSLVKDDIDDGWRLLEQLVRDGFDVAIAFWVRFEFEEDGPWFYIVSKTVDQKGIQAAYRDIHESIQRIPDSRRPWNSVAEIFELRLVGPNDPLARELLTFRDRYPGRNRFRGVRIGSYLLEDLCIYPPLTKSNGVDEGRCTLTVELSVPIWEKLHTLAAAPTQGGTSPVSASELAADIIEKYVVDAAS